MPLDNPGGDGGKGEWNGITTKFTKDDTHLVIQVVLIGKPGDWVEYNGSQLDSLILHLKEQRAKLKTGGSDVVT